MPQVIEKRQFARHNCSGSITLSHTNRESRQIHADLVDLSEQGLSFNSHQPLVPGTTIIVRASEENYRKMDVEADFQLRTMGFATIKWCQSHILQGRTIHRMGAAYVMPW